MSCALPTPQESPETHQATSNQPPATKAPSQCSVTPVPAGHYRSRANALPPSSSLYQMPLSNKNERDNMQPSQKCQTPETRFVTHRHLNRWTPGSTIDPSNSKLRDGPSVTNEDAADQFVRRPACLAAAAVNSRFVPATTTALPSLLSQVIALSVFAFALGRSLVDSRLTLRSSVFRTVMARPGLCCAVPGKTCHLLGRTHPSWG
jgi:hypothetical protein